MSSPQSTAPNENTATPKKSWGEAWLVYLRPESLRMLSLGFAAGLPLLLVLGTLSFRLREAGVDRSTIGHLSWVGLAYGFKWMWAPIVDRVPLPWLTHAMGRRRSWLLVSQIAVMCGLAGMAFSNPQTALGPVVVWALVTAFASATQDISLDAYRIESAPSDEQAALAASYQLGYRLAMIWSGAGVLWLAARSEVAAQVGTYQDLAWKFAYLMMAASMIVGIITVLVSRESQRRELPPARGAKEWLESALIEPFADFFRRYKWHAAVILALIAIYRISDVVMGIMANPFYVDMGFTKDEVLTVVKTYGIVMTIVGGFVGGALSMRFGVMRVLMLGAILSALTNLLFAWLATIGHNVPALILVISADNLASGIASGAFIGYLSSLTNISYSASQYALFSSLMLLLPKFVAGFSGDFVNAFGYSNFFMSTAALGLPVLLLVWAAGKVKKSDDSATEKPLADRLIN